jgi:CheY-like chemotaxis protein
MPHKVLFIEDSPANAEIITYRLRRLGLEALKASDGYVGLEVAAQHEPDLILLDYMLPGMNGEEIMKRLREIPVMAETPVVMVTADCSAERERMAMALGCAGFLCKPVTSTRLEQMLRNILGDDAIQSRPRPKRNG